MNLRRLVKAALFAAAALIISPLALVSWIEKHLLRSEWVFTGCAQLLALMPGWPGTRLRGAFYWAALDSCSWETDIGFGTLFTHRHARLAPQVSTGNYCVLGHVNIGPDTRLASRVSIPSGKRQHLDEAGALSAITQFDTVSIGEGCWVGEGAIVLADVGARSIVGAGAVVSRSIPSGSLAGGNPAAVVRELPGRT